MSMYETTKTICFFNLSQTNCFVEREAAFCGNRIVEEDEQCDCGFQEDCEQMDKCCHGKGHENECKRTEDADCR